MRDKNIKNGWNSLLDLVLYREAYEGDRTAYHFLGQGEEVSASLSYRELAEKSRGIGAVLKKYAKPGDRAILMYPPGLDFIGGFLGCLFAGVIAVPAFPPHPARTGRNEVRLVSIAEDSQPSVVLTNGEVARTRMAALAATPIFSNAQVLESDQVHPIPLTARKSAEDNTQANSSTLALLQYSSGSTGDPKGVVVNHGNLVANLSYIDGWEENDVNTVSLSWLPHFHDMGLIEGILLPLYRGTPAYLMPPHAFLQRPFRWLNAITQFGITNTGGPNFAYDHCVRRVTAEQCQSLDLKSWRLAYNGAEPVRHETLRTFREAFAGCGFNPKALSPCYGLAEATLLVSGLKIRNAEKVLWAEESGLAIDQIVLTESEAEGSRAIVSCGTFGEETQVVIAHPDQLIRLPPGKVGEIWVSGPGVAQGYWNKNGESRSAFQATLKDTGAGPFLRTGDLGFLWEDELYITGRYKDVIIIRGRKLYPHDIEATMEAAHPAILHHCCAAIGVDDGESENLVLLAELNPRHAYIQPGNGHGNQDTYQQILIALREAVAGTYEVQPQAILLLAVGTIPKTSSNKIRRSACKNAYLAEGLNVAFEWCRQPIVKACSPGAEGTDART